MRTRIVPAAALTAVLLTGCTSFAAEPTGPEALAAAVAALERAGSVRVEGTTPEGEPIEIHVQDDDAVGFVAMASDYNAPFVAVDGRGYLLPPFDYLAEMGASEEDIAAFSGRYLPMVGDDWRDQIPGSLADVTERFLPAEVLDGVAHETVDGRPVLLLTGEDGVQLFVAACAPHEPVQLVLPADEDAMANERTLRFSDLGVRRGILAPEDPVPLEALGG